MSSQAVFCVRYAPGETVRDILLLAVRKDGHSEGVGLRDKVMRTAVGLQGDDDHRRFQRNGCERTDRHAMLFPGVRGSHNGNARSPGAHGLAKLFWIENCGWFHIAFMIAARGAEQIQGQKYSEDSRMVNHKIVVIGPTGHKYPHSVQIAPCYFFAC